MRDVPKKMGDREKREYRSDEVLLSVESLPNCIVEYRVHAEKELVKRGRERAARTVAKEALLPGFRKGKAPVERAVEKYPDLFEKEWKKEVANLAFQACQKLTQIPLLERDTRISFTFGKWTPDGGGEMTFSFETEPRVPEIDCEALAIEEVEKTAIDSAKIEGALRQIQLFFASWQPQSDRGVEMEDHILVDIDLLEDPSTKQIASNTRFEVTERWMAEWLREIVIGMRIGEVREGKTRSDSDDSEEEHAPQRVRITLKGIEEPLLPPIDEELAKKMGVETVEEMKSKAEQFLKRQEGERVEKMHQRQIEDLLLEKYPFELPNSLVRREVEFRMKQAFSIPGTSKRLEKMSEREKNEEIAHFRLSGESAIRLFYIARKIVRDHEIPVVPDQTDSAIPPSFEIVLDREKYVRKQSDQSHKREAVATSHLILDKAMGFLAEKVEFTSDKSSDR